MSDKFITLNTLTEWLDDTEEQIKNEIVNTVETDKQVREDKYFLYQAAQRFRAQVLGHFSEEVEFVSPMYDE